MNLRWNNIIAALIGIGVLIFVLGHIGSCRAALETIASVAPHERMDDRFVGFMVLGVIAVTLLSLVKTILNRNRSNDRRGRRDDPPED